MGGSSCEAWEEGVHCCRVEEIKIPKVLGTSTEELAVDRPSFFASNSFSFFSILIGCMTSRCCFCHVSSLVLCLYHVCECVCVYARAHGFSTRVLLSCMVCMVGYR